MWDALKGYKTTVFFALYLVTSLASLAGFLNWQPTADQASAVAAIVALVGILLRVITDSPVFKKY